MQRTWDRARVIAVLGTLKDDGISAQRMAKMAGVNRSTIYRWMAGEVAPEYVPVRALAWALWPRHPDLARELTEASGWPWQEPSEAERSPPPTPMEELLGTEEAEQVRRKIRARKGAHADWYISAVEDALSQPPEDAADSPAPGAPRARRQG